MKFKLTLYLDNRKVEDKLCKNLVEVGKAVRLWNKKHKGICGIEMEEIKN